MRVSANWFLSDHWLVNGDVAVSRLMNSAADSPITEERTGGALALTLACMF
jgi:outer membrane scaffolding protein for murein synthesis (MipA/OmpV family)